MEAEEVCAVSPTLSSVVLENLKVYQFSVVRVECTVL